MTNFENPIAEKPATPADAAQMPPPQPEPPPAAKGRLRKWLQNPDIIALAVLVCAALYYLLPELVLVLVWFFVTLPLALVLYLSALISGPLLLGQPAYWLLAWRYPARRRGQMWALSLGAGMAIFALAGFALNLPGRIAAWGWVAQDFDRIGPPPAAGLVVGYAIAQGQGDSPACDGTCIRLLLNGRAKAVVIAAAPVDPQADPLAQRGLRFSLSPGTAPCPAAALDPSTDIGPARKPDEMPLDLAMQGRIAAGDCLLSVPATLAEADLLWAERRLQEGAARRSYAFGAATLQVARMQLWQRRAGALAESYCKTSVRAREIFPWPVPMWVWHEVFFTEPEGMGWSRREVRWNAPPKRGAESELAALLQDRLGLDLTLSTQEVDAALTGQIAAILDRPDALDANQLALIARFQAAAGVFRPITAETWALHLRLFSDPRLPADANHAASLRNFLLERPQDLPRFAEAIFARLARGNAADYAAIDTTSAWLPAQVLAPYRAQILEIARNPEQRMAMDRLVVRLGEVDPQSLPVFLEMIDTAPDLGKKEGAEQLRLGLRGLCRAGALASTLAPQLLERLKDRRLGLQYGKADLALQTFLELGVAPEALRKGFTQPAKRLGLPAIEPEKFDRAVKRALATGRCE